MSKPEFIAIIGETRIPTSAKVIAAFIRAQGSCPFKFVPADMEQVETDEPGADWSQP